MSWVKLDDGFHRNQKQLRMSNAAFRLYVCSLSYCAQEREPTGYMSSEQADALRRALRQGAKAVDELIDLNAWEVADGGYLIHDYDEYLEKGSRDRVRKHRELKRLGNVTDQLLARDGYPVPEPVPVEKASTKPSYPPNPPMGAMAVTVLNGSYGVDFDGFVAQLSEATGRRFRGSAVSRKLYAARRRDGYSANELLAAARGVALSKHHMGLNDSSMPYNAPENVLRSKVLTQLIALGSGEIGVVRQATAAEQRQAEIAEWVARHDGERQA